MTFQLKNTTPTQLDMCEVGSRQQVPAATQPWRCERLDSLHQETSRGK